MKVSWKEMGLELGLLVDVLCPKPDVLVGELSVFFQMLDPGGTSEEKIRVFGTSVIVGLVSRRDFNDGVKTDRKGDVGGLGRVCDNFGSTKGVGFHVEVSQKEEGSFDFELSVHFGILEEGDEGDLEGAEVTFFDDDVEVILISVVALDNSDHIEEGEVEDAVGFKELLEVEPFFVEGCVWDGKVVIPFWGDTLEGFGLEAAGNTCVRIE